MERHRRSVSVKFTHKNVQERTLKINKLSNLNNSKSLKKGIVTDPGHLLKQILYTSMMMNFCLNNPKLSIFSSKKLKIELFH